MILCLYCEEPMQFLNDEARAAAEKVSVLFAHTECYAKIYPLLMSAE